MSQSSPKVAPQNFIRALIDEDLAAQKNEGRVVTRFPPEPNGYLHIGHAKAICINFGLARDIPGAVCHLRMDDTNPEAEETEFVESIKEDIRWLGFDWNGKMFYASDYFERLYQFAEELIGKGLAYVCELPEQEARRLRGSITEPGTPSPFRERTVEENLDLFRRMRAGEFNDGQMVLRAKIDMAAANMKMRDPAIYRIRHVAHHRTKDAWCIYPLYDFTHCLSDSLEKITHSLCSLEFGSARELYDWFVEKLDTPSEPHQYEFARLNLTYTVTSKRKLRHLVEEGVVTGWDDPRMPTISGYRRRGVRPEAIVQFIRSQGVARNASTSELSQLEYAIREDLNSIAPRVMAVTHPLKVVVTNYQPEKTELFDAPYFPPDVPRDGSRQVPFCAELYIEADDFMEVGTKHFKRLTLNGEVRLRHAYVLKCNEVVKDAAGQVVELRCTIDASTRDGAPADGRRISGAIHWVSARHALPAEIRLYDRLFSVESPDASQADFTQCINPESLTVVQGFVESSVEKDQEGTRYQFERLGFFWRDPASPGGLVFNRIVTLKDGWAKLSEVVETGQSKETAKQEARRKARIERKEEQAARDKQRVVELEPEVELLVQSFGLPAEQARVIHANPVLSDVFAAATRAEETDANRLIASWLAVDVASAIKEEGRTVQPPSAEALRDLAALVSTDRISARSSKEVLSRLLTDGESPAHWVKQLGLAKISDPLALRPIAEGVIALFPKKAAEYRAGNKNLMGLFVGQVMQKTSGNADPKVLGRVLAELLNK